MYYILIKKITIGTDFLFHGCREKVNAENGWHYISCTDCHKKAKTIGSTFWCQGCKKGFSSPTIRLVLVYEKD